MNKRRYMSPHAQVIEMQSSRMLVVSGNSIKMNVSNDETADDAVMSNTERGGGELWNSGW